MFRSFIFLNTFLVLNIVHFVAPTSQPSPHAPTSQPSPSLCEKSTKSSSPCKVAAVTVQSCLITVACCFCALRLLASPCEVAHEVTPSLCRPHCPSLVRFLHLKVSIWTLTTHYCCFVEWVKLVVVLLQEQLIKQVSLYGIKILLLSPEVEMYWFVCRICIMFVHDFYSYMLVWMVLCLFYRC